MEVPFSLNQKVMLSGLSSDGKKLYFEKDDDIWMVERTTNGWGEPQCLPVQINSTSNDHSYTETTDGTIYVGSSRPGGSGRYLNVWQINQEPDNSLQAKNPGLMIN
ncbi:hypothetical protein ACE01N_04310 [Saccharicrinis sp. FJH2]|uniref:hypothetical protein n=1 Tax=Saccharicrinis sp. FJH65 TaxID=3344659 RepID=UPI0035F4451C